jgi:hypothetical protein
LGNHFNGDAIQFALGQFIDPIARQKGYWQQL